MKPTYLTSATSPDRFVGAYGTRWTSGVLSEHLDLFKRAGGVHRPSPTDGAGWALIPGENGGMLAVPIVCSELIRVDTEDGPQSGRCGHPALDETGTCPAHDPRPYDA